MTEKIEVEYNEQLDEATEVEVVEYKLRNRTLKLVQITVMYDLPIPLDDDFEEALSKKSMAQKSRARMMFIYDSEKRTLSGHYDSKKVKQKPLISRVLDEDIHNTIMSNSEPHKTPAGELIEGLWNAPIRVVYAATADDEGYAITCNQLVAIAVPEDDDH